jgi:prepilin signal peptidase PulO-like enzyme (type II secretory pathway)
MANHAAVISVVLMVLGSGVLGAGVAWLRPDLDLAARRTGAEASALSMVFAIILFAVGLTATEMAILFAVAAPLCILDLRSMVLPDLLTLPLIAVGLTGGILAGTAPGFDRFIGAVIAYAALRGLGMLWLRLRNEEAMGQGDAKLFAAIGAFVGWQALPEVALTAALAAIAVILGCRKGKASRAVAFGPALIFGALTWVLAGPLLT